MHWLFLFVAGLFEVGWAIGLKYTEGFTRFLPTLGTVVGMIVSLGLLGVGMKPLPVGTAYAVWAGVGTVGTAVLGIVLFAEPATPVRLASPRPDRRRDHRPEAREPVPPRLAKRDPRCLFLLLK